MKKQCPSCSRRYPIFVFRDGICLECWELKRRRARPVARKALQDALDKLESNDVPEKVE